MDVQDLEVYQKLFKLGLEVHELAMSFPKFELYEIGSQLRRSSNAVPAILAEGFGNKHTTIYKESISRSQGELRETLHHIRFSHKKGYFKEEILIYFVNGYTECSKMLYGLDRSLKA
jgi:four helix bundle protein